MAAFDNFLALNKKDPAAVRRWVNATIANDRMTAAAPLARSPEAAGMAGAISDLNLALQGRANQHIIDYEARNKAADQSLRAQLDAIDAQNAQRRNDTSSYLSDVASQLGLQAGLNSATIKGNQANFDQIQAINATNRANQQASRDLLNQGYDEVMVNQAGGYDAQTAQSLGALYAAIAALPVPGSSSGGGSSGGGHSRRRSGSGSGSGGSKSKSAVSAGQLVAESMNPGVSGINPNNPLAAFAHSYNPIVPGYYTGKETPPGGSSFAGVKTGKKAISPDALKRRLSGPLFGIGARG